MKGIEYYNKGSFFSLAAIFLRIKNGDAKKQRQLLRLGYSNSQ